VGNSACPNQRASRSVCKWGGGKEPHLGKLTSKKKQKNHKEGQACYDLGGRRFCHAWEGLSSQKDQKSQGGGEGKKERGCRDGKGGLF